MWKVFTEWVHCIFSLPYKPKLSLNRCWKFCVSSTEPCSRHAFIVYRYSHTRSPLFPHTNKQCEKSAINDWHGSWAWCLSWLSLPCSRHAFIVYRYRHSHLHYFGINKHCEKSTINEWHGSWARCWSVFPRFHCLVQDMRSFIVRYSQSHLRSFSI